MGTLWVTAATVVLGVVLTPPALHPAVLVALVEDWLFPFLLPFPLTTLQEQLVAAVVVVVAEVMATGSSTRLILAAVAVVVGADQAQQTHPVVAGV